MAAPMIPQSVQARHVHIPRHPPPSAGLSLPARRVIRSPRCQPSGGVESQPAKLNPAPRELSATAGVSPSRHQYLRRATRADGAGRAQTGSTRLLRALFLARCRLPRLRKPLVEGRRPRRRAVDKIVDCARLSHPDHRFATRLTSAKLRWSRASDQWPADAGLSVHRFLVSRIRSRRRRRSYRCPRSNSSFARSRTTVSVPL